MAGEPSILVHGGAGPLSPDDDPQRAKDGCLRAAQVGHGVLRRGGSALDAVVEAVRVLEDDPVFNAGTGSCLNADGDVEMDAALMEGTTLRGGAVAAVRAMPHPIDLARAVMERTPHVLLAGQGAERFADEIQLARCAPGALVTERARRRWSRHTDAKGHGTVGAVARDAAGRLAAATSTGGMTGKRPGRVGDSPLLGAGTYADDRGAAASATGHGEPILRVCLTKVACELARGGATAEAACRGALSELARIQGEGGLILVDRLGQVFAAFNTQRMARAWCGPLGSGAAFD